MSLKRNSRQWPTHQSQVDQSKMFSRPAGQTERGVRFSIPRAGRGDRGITMHHGARAAVITRLRGLCFLELLPKYSDLVLYDKLPAEQTPGARPETEPTANLRATPPDRDVWR
jgi:hypothetical protein